LDILPTWYEQLQHWSLSGRLTAAAQEALLLDGEPQALKDLVSQWSKGDFKGIPEIVLLSNMDINGALGAYAQSIGKIYLNADWLKTATQEAVNAVLTEELGHHLDGLLNTVDTAGDEGEYFSRHICDGALDSNLVDGLRFEVDNITVYPQTGFGIDAEASYVLGAGSTVSVKQLPIGERLRLEILGGWLYEIMTEWESNGNGRGIGKYSGQPFSADDSITAAILATSLANYFGQYSYATIGNLIEINPVTVSSVNFKAIIYGATGHPYYPRLIAYADTGTASYDLNTTYSVNSNASVNLLSVDPDGIVSGSTQILWQASSDQSSWLDISTEIDLPISSGFANKYVRAIVSYVDKEGFSEKVNTRSAYILPPVDNGDAVFSITGTPVVGNLLTATNTTADPDGNGVFTYAWQTSSDGTTWSPVGTNSASYRVATADEGKQIKLVVTYLDAQNFSESVTTATGKVPFLEGSFSSTQVYGFNAAIARDSFGADRYVTLDRNAPYAYQRIRISSSSSQPEVDHYVRGNFSQVAANQVLGKIYLIDSGSTGNYGNLFSLDLSSGLQSEQKMTHPDGFDRDFREILDNGYPFRDRGYHKSIYTTSSGATFVALENSIITAGNTTGSVHFGYTNSSLNGKYKALDIPTGHQFAGGGFARFSNLYDLTENPNGTVSAAGTFRDNSDFANERLPASFVLTFNPENQAVSSFQILSYYRDIALGENGVSFGLGTSYIDRISSNGDIHRIYDAGFEGQMGSHIWQINDSLTVGTPQNIVLLTGNAYDLSSTLAKGAVCTVSSGIANLNDVMTLEQSGILITSGNNSHDSYDLVVHPFVNNGQAVFSITGASTPNAPAVGNLLTSTNTTVDPDGNGTFAYSWQTSSDGTTWSPVGTNSSSYTVATGDKGKQIQLVVSYLDSQNFSESIIISAGTIPSSITLAVLPTSVTEDATANLVYTFTRTGATTKALTVKYGITGTADSSDYTGATPGTGKTITFAAGASTATLTIDPTADTTIESDETVALTLEAGTGYTIGTTTAVLGTISNDDKLIPAYTVTSSAGTINEGSTLTTTVATTNVATGTTLYWSVGGTGINTSDFSAGALTGSSVVDTDGKFSIAHTAANDLATEGDETLQIKLFADSALTAQAGSTASVTLKDTSLTPAPTYAVTPSSSSINEGATLTTNVATTNVASGTTLYWSVGGTGINASDFSKGSLAGSGTVGADGKFSFSHKVASDLTTEGGETLQLKLFSDSARTLQVGSTASVLVKDISIKPAATYVLTPSSNSINEGATLTTNVATTNLASGTTLFWSVGGTGINAADFTSGALVGSGTVGADGKFSFSHTLANDLTTEGDESLQIKLFSDSARTLQVGSTANVTLKDTSFNNAPTDLRASASRFNSNVLVDSTISILNTVDQDLGNTFTYALVSGTGSADNGAFAISGNQLVLKTAPNYASKKIYSIRVKCTDQGGLSTEKILGFVVNGAPTDLTSTASFNENIAAATPVATLGSVDQDTGDTFTYSLVSGAGSADNGAFTLVGNQLQINASPDFETKSSYAIRVRTTDQDGLLVEKNLNFAVNNLVEKVASGASIVMATNKDTLQLTGTKNIFGMGNQFDNTITGNSGRNKLTGGLGKDVLTGGAGVDTFFYSDLKESLLSGFDVITDFAAIDRINVGFNFEGDDLIASKGKATSFNEGAISSVLTNTTFLANNAAAFMVEGLTGTFLALNDGRDGFQADSDALIHLSKYTIGSTTPISII